MIANQHPFGLRQHPIVRCSVAVSLSVLLLTLVACRQQPVPGTSPVAIASPQSQSVTRSGEPVRVGILVIDSAVSVTERYRPLMDYLTEAIGRPFELIPLTQESQFTAVQQNQLDFTLNNPLAAVQIQRLYNTRFLATHSRPKTGSKFSALIVVRRNSNIRTLEDLRGKKAACVNFQTAAAGCVFQIYHLQQNGIDPFTDFSSFIENPSQDNIVLAVLNSSIDVGFIRTGQLEKMVRKGLIENVEEVRILAPEEDNFFYSHTTRLYPEWPVATLDSTDPMLVTKVQQALLKMPADHPALAAAKLDGFVATEDYTTIHKLIETLQLTSWDAR